MNKSFSLSSQAATWVDSQRGLQNKSEERPFYVNSIVHFIKPHTLHFVISNGSKSIISTLQLSLKEFKDLHLMTQFEKEKSSLFRGLGVYHGSDAISSFLYVDALYLSNHSKSLFYFLFLMRKYLTGKNRNLYKTSKSAMTLPGLEYKQSSAKVWSLTSSLVPEWTIGKPCPVLLSFQTV